jgi:gluconolactonase
VIIMRSLSLLVAVLTTPLTLSAQVTRDVPTGNPTAIVDLRTSEGAKLLGATWRFHDAAVVEVDHHAPGPDLKPTGPLIRTHDIAPQAGVPGFDDRGWDVIPATSLEQRRSSGRLSFAWYRLVFTIPEVVGAFRTAGSTAVFEIVLDDYSEVWVNGALPTALGQGGGGLVSGWNTPNRVVVARDVKPGQQVELAIFGANGPLSAPPGNYIWIRSATLDFYKDGTLGTPRDIAGEIKRLDPAVDRIAPRDAKIEKIASGFQFTEGPLWHPQGYLLFSDPNANTIYRWTPDGGVSVFRTKSGYADADIGEYHQPGSNGLTLDREGRVVIDEHGRRRVVRLETNGLITVLADRYDGRRLNSPNDLVYKSDGSLFFTDPPFGLPKVFADPRKELRHSGVYRLKDGVVRLMTDELTGPNGLAFSPDERWLYVSNWDEQRKVIMRYPVLLDGTIDDGEVFLDVTASDPGEQAWDGVKVDQEGNVYAAGPGGIWILTPEGRHIGTISPPEAPANMTFGDADGRTLYITARTSVYRVRLNIPGIRPLPATQLSQGSPR